MRDSTIDKKVLETDAGKIEVKLVPDEEGLFILLNVADQKIIGAVATYVDDILAVGEAPAVAAFMAFIKSTWSTKFSGFITRGIEESISHGDFTMSRIPELTFIGLQISFDDEQQVVFHQRRWILSELHKRGWVHLTGTQSLPQIDLSTQEPTDSPEYARDLNRAWMPPFGVYKDTP